MPVDQPQPTTQPAPPQASQRRAGPPPPSSQGQVTAHHRAWRDRLPDVAAGIGTALVAVASAGFVSSSWLALAGPSRAMLLLAASAAMTVSALWFERLQRRGTAQVVGLILAAASAMTAAGATLGFASLQPGLGRLAILVGGVAGFVHVISLLLDRRDSAALVMGAWASALFAAGPFGSAWTDRWSSTSAEAFATPLRGFFDPLLQSSAHVITGVAHLAVGVALIVAIRHLSGAAAITARALAILTMAYAALELNVLAEPLGAVAALGIVIGLLLVGLWSEDLSMVVGAVFGAFAAGLRVLAAVFTGKVLATAALMLTGLALLAWALRAITQRRPTVPVDEI